MEMWIVGILDPLALEGCSYYWTNLMVNIDIACEGVSIGPASEEGSS